MFFSWEKFFLVSYSTSTTSSISWGGPSTCQPFLELEGLFQNIVALRKSSGLMYCTVEFWSSYSFSQLGQLKVKVKSHRLRKGKTVKRDKGQRDARDLIIRARQRQKKCKGFGYVAYAQRKKKCKCSPLENDTTRLFCRRSVPPSGLWNGCRTSMCMCCVLWGIYTPGNR